MKKKNVCVVFGGKSGEHEVSLMSAYNILKAIDREQFFVTMLGIDKEGRFISYNGDIEKIKNGTWENDSAADRNLHLFNDSYTDSIDIFFPVLHGTFGEDGTIQGLFEMLDKPYVGCGVLASSAMMDKDTAKLIFAQAGLTTAKGVVKYRSEILDDIEFSAEEIEKDFAYPVFVKPANMGSSVGISKASDRSALISALNEAAKYDTKILVEEFIKGKEIEVGVLGNENAQASCPGMIVPCNEFYDYDAKYLRGDDSAVIIPAPLSENISEQIRACALKAFTAAGLSGLSRVDFFVTDDERIVINEVNTLPGFTNISMYPKLWEQCGIAYSELITKLIKLGFERYETRKKLSFRKL